MLSERVADGGERKASRAISETPIGEVRTIDRGELGEEVGWRWCPDLFRLSAAADASSVLSYEYS